MKYLIALLFSLIAGICSAGMIIGTGGVTLPGTVTFDAWDADPVQLTADFTPGTPAGSTYNLYYALNSVASVIPGNNDCTYLLLTSYDVGLTSFPSCTASDLSGCTATAGKITGITGSPYTVASGLTASSVYCARVSAVDGMEGLGSATRTATAGTALAAYTDNFNRANGALGANWGTPTGATTAEILVNVYTTGSGGQKSNYYDNTFADNQYSISKQVSSISDIVYGGPAVRMQTGSRSGYYCQIYDFEGDITLELIELNTSGVPSVLGSIGSLSAADIWLKITASGTTIKAFTSTNGTAWTERISVTDATLASGKAGLVIDGVISLDDWSGGDL